MADGPDMENRDPNNLNDHIKVAFHDVLGEPEGAHSIDCCWLWSYKCFNLALKFCYRLLTIFCAIPCAFCWGCDFACMAFCHVWYYTPYVRALAIEIGAIRKIFQLCLDCLVSPLCESCGSFFSRVRVVNASE